MFKEFKEFISRGNVIDMAIGVIIAEAFGKIVTAFTDSFIKPLLGCIGGAEIHGAVQIGSTGQYIDFGAFLTAVINFLIVAFILFAIVKSVNIANKKSKERLEKLSAKLPMKKGKKANKEEEEKEPETKLCPFCLSEIPYKATRCAHCTAELKEDK